MTEAEWRVCADPTPMLTFLRDKVSERKWRLVACAGIRAVWASLTAHSSRRSVEVAEQFADGLVSEKDLHRAHSMACDAAHSFVRNGRRNGSGDLDPVVVGRHFLAADAALPGPRIEYQVTSTLPRILRSRGDDDLREALPSILRCVVGVPFRVRTPIDPRVLSWESGLVGHLAGAAYEERSLPDGLLHGDRIGVLADALEDAGCLDAELLEHLRGPGPHVRGCWALDAILGKE
jgi:hypothetical protein